MAVFALSWYRPPYWRERLGKRQERGVSPYHSADYDKVEAVASHINSLNPEMACRVEILR